MADDKNTPMGGNLPEDGTGRAEDLLNRNCWAIDILIAEIASLFDGVVIETSEPNWVNANTVVEFMPESKDWEDIALLMAHVKDDERIAGVTLVEKDASVTVEVVKNAILYDTRDSFGLVDAAMGLDRELTPDDLTDLAADLASGGEGFVEGSP
jgi:hypothetical protein